MNPLTLEWLYPFLLAFLRALGLLLLMPVFSAPSIPGLVRAVLMGLLAAVGVAYIPAASLVVPAHWLVLVWAGMQEFAVGLLMGWSARMLFQALEFAGQIISTEIGLILSTSLDPISRSSSSPGASLLTWLGTMLFLVSGAYRECFGAFAQSFAVFPPGSALSAGVAEFVVRCSGSIFGFAVQLAAPVIAINFFINFIFALVSRVAPSLDAYSGSIPVRLFAGVAMLGMSLPLAAQLISQDLRGLPELILKFLS